MPAATRSLTLPDRYPFWRPSVVPKATALLPTLCTATRPAWPSRSTPSERFLALDFADSLAASVSPILFVSSDDPPVLLIHGDADRLVPIRNSEDMHAALLEAGVTTEFITIPDAGHGFRGDDAERARVAVVEWFETHLKGK